MAKSKRLRRKRSSSGRRGGGLMIGMRSGFKGIAGSVAGAGDTAQHRWLGRIITVLLVAAAVGLLATKL